MTTPRRNPYKLAANGIAATIRNHDIDRYDLAIAALRADLHNVGWPARTPADDQADRPPRAAVKCACGEGFANVDAWTAHANETGHRTRLPVDPDEASALDYADPTGEQAGHVGKHHDDLNKIQDLHSQLTHVLKALDAVTKPYVPTICAEPVCSRNDCDDAAERNNSGNGYRGCTLIAGIWCAKPDVRILCGRHRKQAERTEREEAEARAELIEQHAGVDA